MTDDRFTEAAFEQYRQTHGISDDRRLGDMPLRVMSEVMQAAQQLKTKEESNGRAVTSAARTAQS